LLIPDGPNRQVRPAFLNTVFAVGGDLMKLRLCVATFLAATAMMTITQSAHATLFFSDGFDYPDGDLTVFDGTGDNVSGGLWAPHSGTANPIPVAVSGGQAVVVQGNPASEDVNRLAGQTIALGETWYFGALVTIVDTRNGNGLALDQDSYFMHLKDNTSGGFRARIYADDPLTGVGGAGFNFGLSASSGNVAVNWAVDSNFGQQYLVMGSYAVDTGETKLWVDPTSSASSSITHTLPAAAFTAIESLALRQDFVTAGNTYTAYIDSVALGTTFDDVYGALSAIPEPTTGAFALLSVLGLVIGSRRRIA
jgi:hypothetical protein